MKYIKIYYLYILINHSLGAKSAELHRPVRHSENKYKHIQKLKKAGALGIVDKLVVFISSKKKICRIVKSYFDIPQVYFCLLLHFIHVLYLSQSYLL